MCLEKVSGLVLYCTLSLSPPKFTLEDLSLISLEEQSSVLLISLILCDGKDTSERTLNSDMNMEMHPIFGDVFFFLLTRSHYVVLMHSYFLTGLQD